MSKKTFLILGVSILVLLIFGGSSFYLYTKLSHQNLANPQVESKPETLLLYEDEAGFSFQYPNTLGVVEKDVNDETVYSSLELSGKSHPGEKMTIKITDTALSTVDKWLEKNSQAGNLLTSNAISLAGMKGESFQYANPAKNLTLVIDSGILYYLDSPSDRGFWDKTFNFVSSSFKLTEEKTTTSVGGGASVIEEEEEIIQ